ncbi:proteasome accessory factor PafA2 [Aquihabitans sp. G128]|uniref:depupylase/deamidase Dop n=1 Tax=Aquihabitans sp. G128 TaxID=2849779 RepID=UPI001C21AEBE|nr:depupylase/deamidase Dop [Aquihabitans sp. G128]QXC62042.1 proteasome accessory factor PafA2 [Aquihabitans sp. G128]
MAVHKVIGIETEFGIVHRGAGESNPVTASSMLINAYLGDLARAQEGGPKVGWDFEDESPGNDARGPAGPSSPPEVETHLVNAVLTNGARYYVDHAHPECSTPECADARSVVVFDRAAEQILQRSIVAANRLLPEGQELVVHKNNSDGKGNSYGCHENYLMDRAVPFGKIITHATAHFISRQLYTGSGKIGSEAPGLGIKDVPFQLTQRADFFEAEVGLETTLKRPIINTRDEPHADAQRYRRLHVITGDANCSETATFLKVGATAFVLAMVEDDALPRTFAFRSPVQAMRQVSYDLGLHRPLELVDGTTVTALEVQWELLDRARKWGEERGLETVGGEVGAQVLDTWEQVLTGLESDPMALADRLDWVAKYRILNGYRDRHGVGWDDPRLAALALQYHDVRPERSLSARAGLVRLTTDDEATRAMTDPPTDTRAYFRGRCLQRWADQVVAANWDSIVFDVGEDSLRRVPMMEPLRGTRAHVGTLVDESATPAELLARLSGA